MAIVVRIGDGDGSGGGGGGISTPVTTTEPWVTPDDMPCEGGTEEERTQAAILATAILWAASGRRFGIATDKVRPVGSCYSGLVDPWGYFRYPFASLEGCCHCGRDVARDYGGVPLETPVWTITKVTVDGVDLLSSDYAVIDNVLIPTGDTRFPGCQDLAKPATEVGTFQVEYEYGSPLPESGALAAAVLACELVKAFQGDASCKLPARVQTVTRQGVTMALLDDLSTIREGWTGLPAVDGWLASVNPERLTMRPQIITADGPLLRRRLGG